MSQWSSLTKKWEESPAVQETSLDAYKGIAAELGPKRQKVLNGFNELGSATNREVSYLLNMPINTVTPRTNELVKMGILTMMGKRVCKQGGKMSIIWGVC